VSTGEESFGAKGGVASGKQKDDFVTGLEVVVLMLQHRVKVLEQMIDGHIQVYQLTVVLSWNLVALDSVNTSLEGRHPSLPRSQEHGGEEGWSMKLYQAGA